MTLYVIRKTFLRSCDWWLGIGLLGLGESRAPIQIASSQENQGLETAFGFILVLNKSNLETVSLFCHLARLAQTHVGVSSWGKHKEFSSYPGFKYKQTLTLLREAGIFSLRAVDFKHELYVSGWNCSVWTDSSPWILPKYILNNRRCDGCSLENTPAGRHADHDSLGNRHSQVCTQDAVLHGGGGNKQGRVVVLISRAENMAWLMSNFILAKQVSFVRKVNKHLKE